MEDPDYHAHIRMEIEYYCPRAEFIRGIDSNGYRTIRKKKSCGLRLKMEGLTTALEEEPECEEGISFDQRYEPVAVGKAFS